MFVKLMVRDSWGESNHRLLGSGWIKDIPFLVNEYVVTTFLKVIRDKMVSTPDFSFDHLKGESGYEPYSMLEWNDVMASVYAEFVCDGNAQERPIVYVTQPSKRNIKIGEYRVFEYHRYEPPTIRNPQVVDAAMAQQQPRNGRSFPDLFWLLLCSDKNSYPISAGSTTTVSLELNIRVIVVGYVLQELKAGGQNPTKLARKAHSMQISPRHRVSDLFRDYESFSQFITNANKSHWKFLHFPDYQKFDPAPRNRLLATMLLCKDLKLDVPNNGISHDLNAGLCQVIRQGKLTPILRMGMKVMNEEFFEFILNLRREFTQTVLACFEGDDGPDPSYSQHARAVGKIYKEEDRRFVF
jgi:hypothetical protein